MSELAVSQPTLRSVHCCPREEKVLLLSGDVLALLLAFFFGRITFWWFNGIPVSDAYLNWWGLRGDVRLLIFLGLMFLVVGWFLALGHYSQRKPFWDEVKDILKVLLIVATIDVTLVFFGKFEFSRLWLATTWLLSAFLLPLIRTQIKRALIRAGGWTRPTVILGVGKNARDAASALWSEPLLGYDVVAFLSVPSQSAANNCQLPEYVELEDRCVPVIALDDKPEAVLDNLGNPHVVVGLNFRELYENQALLQLLSLRQADLNIVPAMSGLPLFGMEVTHFFRHEVLMLRVRNNLARRGPKIIKRSFDIVASLTLLILLSPVLAFIAWRIKKEDGGPVILAQERIGRGRQIFRCYKFRSMVQNADQLLAQYLRERPEVAAEYERNFKLKNDPRVTRIGKLIRKTSMDELPQLWNVLIGEMSLVGPRPLLERELPHYGQSIEMYKGVRPGITGLWQISGRSETRFADRIYLDTWYVKNWCLWYDIVVLLKTSQVVLGAKGAY